MKIQSSAVVSLSLATLFGFAIGCSEGPSSDTAATHDEHADHDHAPGEHDHPTEGPHHGALVELGAEEFHAEVVHDDTAGVLTVYLLDAKAKEAAKSESAEILINVKQGDNIKIENQTIPIPTKIPKTRNILCFALSDN